MKLIYMIKPPCYKCLYKLGLVHTLTTACPQCRVNSYKTFEEFQRHLNRGYSAIQNKNKKNL